MSDQVKQVKVDNWGIYFLQRLKHFFNRTDYCDLTLQFQDNAQLKVHRLVLSACTEYFELLERTCEMYEDCLVMPDDLQADIVVPIVNFMYTGQLEFRMELLDKLHQCSEIMNMPVLTKLLDSHRPKKKISHTYKLPIKRVDATKEVVQKITPNEFITTSTAPTTYKRSHGKAFEQTTVYRDKKVYLPVNKSAVVTNGGRSYREPSPIPLDKERFNKKVVSGDPRPTRYELPEELDTDNIFENSFCNISYTSQPLMVHPETRKQYAKRPRLAIEASTSKKSGPTTVDIVQCKKPVRIQEDALFEDTIPDDSEMYSEPFVKAECSRDHSQLFDQILYKNEEPPKVTIETKTTKSANLDHAKIISEVLKKYPHLVKSNKNIKLKILNTQTSKKDKKLKLSPTPVLKPVKTEKESDYTFETDVLDSKQAAKLIAMGAENIEGPWICLICGTPGKAMNFTSYYKFRRHLVEVHHEKPVLNICEYCGHRSAKRNYILHHMYTKHGVEPPAQYHFPKCSKCSYIALSEALLVKHKTSSHGDVKNFRCNVCPSTYYTSNELLMHIQSTGHKYSDKKANLQCIYCLKNFMRESNLCAHLKSHHKAEAIKDGIIDDSDDEKNEDKSNIIKAEPAANDYEELDIQYQIQQRPDGNITVVTKKASEPITNAKQKILNTGFSSQGQSNKNKVVGKTSHNAQNEYMQEMESSSNDTQEEIVMIGQNEYIMRDNQLIPRRPKEIEEEYVLSDHGLQPVTPTSTMEFTQENIQHANMVLKNSDNLTQPIPIYISNDEEYKALMASNQPIIFDNGNSNKTLTVLTASHGSTLEPTSIDMNTTTQSNNMMIIQDDYPLSVSEAVTSENSNIVVVYSHQVGDENKQYQLLTTQGLGAQFVQSSAILTQNYETITTTTPVMNSHILDKQVAEVWQNNLHQIVDTNQIEITPVTSSVVHSIVEQANQMQTETITAVPESTTEIVDLPQVELTSNAIETTNSNMSDVSANQCQETVAVEEQVAEDTVENTEHECENVTHNTYDMEVDERLTEHEEVPLDNPVEETEIIIDSTKPTDTILENESGPEEEIVQSSDTVIEETEYIESQTYTQSESNIEPGIDSIDTIQNQSEVMSIDCQTGEIIDANEEETVPDTNIVSEISIPAEQTTRITENVSGQVQTLASEWSEEDAQDQEDAINVIQAEQDNQVENADENIQEKQAETTHDNQDAQEENQVETAPHDDREALYSDPHNDIEISEVEESIENIQQEVQKQMTASTISDEQENILDENDDMNSSIEESLEQEKPVSTSVVVVDPAVAQEKISSLLNDWEDNDSQEDNNSCNETIPTTTDVSIETTEKSAAVNENTDPQEKIKSLVSDWDEDEEENKV